MELDGGITPVDTLYEWSGLVMADQISGTLMQGWGLAGILVAAALLRLLYLAYQRGTYFDLVAYPVYLAFMLFLVQPIEVSVRPQNMVFAQLLTDENMSGIEWGGKRGDTVMDGRDLKVRVPRILALSQKIMKSFVHRSVKAVADNGAYTLFRWQAIVAARERAAILDGPLRYNFHEFLRQCYWPARAAQGTSQETVDPAKVTWRELPVVGTGLPAYEDLLFDVNGYTLPCFEKSDKLRSWLYSHLEENPVHRQAIEAMASEAKKTGGTGASQGSIQVQYLARLLYNETFTPLAQNEIQILKDAIPEYKMLDQRYFATAKQWSLKQGVSGLLSTLSGVMEGASQETIGPTLYYRITLVAPYLYGLLQAVFFMAFPIVGLWSLWPGCYKAIVHFLSTLASIKLWPIFWTFLSRFNVGRLSLPADDPLGLNGSGGSEAMFTSIAMMYAVVPVVCFLVLNLAARAGMVGISNFVGGGSGAGPGIALATGGARAAGGAIAHMGGNG